MEIAGFIIGTAGLVGLYSACMEAIDRLDSYNKTEIEARQLSARLHANQVILQNWANRVGISRGGLRDSHDTRLDDPDTARAVCGILSIIRDLFEDTNIASKKMDQKDQACYWSSELQSNQSIFLNGVSSLPRKRDKLAWAFHGKTKFTWQVESFTESLKHLDMLVPAHDDLFSKGFNQKFDYMSMNDKPFENMVMKS